MVDNDSSGFCIPYTVRATPDKGQVVFTDVPVGNGTIIYRNLHGHYNVYDEISLKKFLAQLSRSEVVYELTHMFGLPEFPGYVIRFIDDGVLINHSRQPNIAMNNNDKEADIAHKTASLDAQSVEEALLDDCYSLVVIQDVKAGDELVMDYTTCIEDPLYYDSLCAQYDVNEPFLDSKVS